MLLPIKLALSVAFVLSTSLMAQAQVADKELNVYLRSDDGRSQLDALTNNAPETFNRVTLLDMGKNSLPLRRKLIEEAKSFIFITAPYWDNDPVGAGIAAAIKQRKREVPGFEDRYIMGWSTPLFSKGTGKILKIVREDENVLMWNSPLWQRNFSFNLGGHEVHDKQIIVDGDKMIMGGMNMTQEYLEGGSKEHGWHDTDIFIEGPAAQVATDAYLKIFTLGKYLAGPGHFSPFNPKKHGVLEENSEIKSFYNYFYKNKEDHDFATIRIKGQDLMPGDYFIGPNEFQVMNRVHIGILPLLASEKYHPPIATDSSFNTSLRFLYDNPLIDRRIDTKHNEHYSKTRNTIKFLLDHAKESAWFFMPYLSLDKEFHDSLVAAAKHLNIKIITNSVESNDMGVKSYKTAAPHYEDFLNAGIEIYEFVGNADLRKTIDANNSVIAENEWPGKTLHSKVVLIDGAVAMIGSNNMNYRSFNKNNETMALINDANFAAGVQSIFMRHFSSFEEAKTVTCRSRSSDDMMTITKPPTIRRVDRAFFELMKATYKFDDKPDFTPGLGKQ